MPPWTADQVGDQRGRVAVVTGANTGIGFEIARVLAGRGATVVLACRDPHRATAAAARITETVPDARISLVELDLASLGSVRQAAAELGRSHPRIDLLINNAGVMWTPHRTTADGFELQLGVNHLGHFALTGLVLPQLLPVPGSRVVTVSSMAHEQGDINFDDLQSQRRYRPLAAYAQSKLANLLFTLELQRRLSDAGASTVAVAAHPGITRTELNRHMPAVTLVRGRNWGLWRLFSHDVGMGALAVLRAATDPGASGGEYYAAPRGWLRSVGHPVLGTPSERARDPERQRRLWAESERLTGVTFPTGLAVH